jgi:hypothetical protein
MCCIFIYALRSNTYFFTGSMLSGVCVRTVVEIINISGNRVPVKSNTKHLLACNMIEKKYVLGVKVVIDRKYISIPAHISFKSENSSVRVHKICDKIVCIT